MPLAAQFCVHKCVHRRTSSATLSKGAIHAGASIRACARGPVLLPKPRVVGSTPAGATTTDVMSGQLNAQRPSGLRLAGAFCSPGAQGSHRERITAVELEHSWNIGARLPQQTVRKIKGRTVRLPGVWPDDSRCRGRHHRGWPAVPRGASRAGRRTARGAVWGAGSHGNGRGVAFPSLNVDAQAARHGPNPR